MKYNTLAGNTWGVLLRARALRTTRHQPDSTEALVVTALLILIVLILVFGAGVVRGWLANLLGLAIGCLLLGGLIIFLVEIFGRDGFQALLLGGGSILLVASIWARASTAKAAQGGTQFSPADNITEGASPSDGLDARDRVWGWYEKEIEGHFDESTKAKALELYLANEVQALDRFCRMHSKAEPF